MRRDPRVLIWDAMEAAPAVAGAALGRSQADHLADRLLRSAVERPCEIVGEAPDRLRLAAPALAARIPDPPQAVAFRQLPSHGHATVDDATVWRSATESLPSLAACPDRLLAELDGTPPAAP